MTFTETELTLLAEALAARASRLESYGRSNPRNAGPLDRRAAAMRALRQKVLDMKTRKDPIAPDADMNWLRKFVRQSVDVKGG